MSDVYITLCTIVAVSAIAISVIACVLFSRINNLEDDK